MKKKEINEKKENLLKKKKKRKSHPQSHGRRREGRSPPRPLALGGVWGWQGGQSAGRRRRRKRRGGPLVWGLSANRAFLGRSAACFFLWVRSRHRGGGGGPGHAGVGGRWRRGGHGGTGTGLTAPEATGHQLRTCRGVPGRPRRALPWRGGDGHRVDGGGGSVPTPAALCPPPPHVPQRVSTGRPV